MELNMLSLTDKARNRIEKWISDTGSDGIKVHMKTAGCTGIMYEVQLLDNFNPLKETIYTVDGFKICVTSEYANSISGATLDYVTNGFNSNFEIINNPNEKARCGCGESFSV
jgi:iron-sulfur cluster assembly protein